MAERDRSHILIPGRASSEPYSPPPRAIPSGPRPVPSNRRQHGSSLRSQLEDANRLGRERRDNESIDIAGAVDGIYIAFESFDGLDEALSSLDPARRGAQPELRMVRTVSRDEATIEQAVVFIPDGKLGYFLSRIDKYLQSLDQPSPRNARLIDRIDSIGLASLEQLWTDTSPFPAADDDVWWEIWLRKRDGEEVARMRAFGAAAEVTVAHEVLAFTDRSVVLAKATPTQLSRALDVLDDVAELRQPRELAEILSLQDAAHQAKWVQDLRSRTTAASPEAPAACILDTGIHQPHPLLEQSLDPADSHSCDATWGVNDHDGHGTEMAGLALYGEVGAAALSSNAIRLRHRLESVKLLPPSGFNPQHLWGALTATATSLVEIQHPSRRRSFGMAITARRDPLDPTPANDIQLGQPTSWSAAVDALAAGLAIDVTNDGMVFLDEDNDRERRLFLISAGNIPRPWEEAFLVRADVEPIEDPGQAWNALTIGAYTESVAIDPSETSFAGWTPLAPAGELSPHSRTSVPFFRQWPIKPDVVFEGGNVARSPNGSMFDTPHSLQSLTTKAPLRDARLLTVTNATSAATSRASHLAASILAEYPSLWAETVRGLIVHSAEWTSVMRSKLSAATSRGARVALNRRYGMGVPDLGRATRSATDALTLIAEDVIHPYSGGTMREMNLHLLPWPIDVLEGLGDATVRMRVTLSYFVDPNPARRGWMRRYRYASHGLRFDVRRPTETTDEFRKRINRLALDEDEKRPRTDSDASEWFFGPDQRTPGSLHTDIWTGTAADLAQRGAIAVYPVAGWWKERPKRDRSDEGARYSLIVSIETPALDVDIWTPVAAEVGIPIEIET